MGVAPSTPAYPPSAYTLVQTVSNWINNAPLGISTNKKQRSWGGNGSDFHSSILPISSMISVSLQALILPKDLSITST
jgi:hypothetical protein